MRYVTAAAFRRALEARLLQQQQTGMSLVRLRKMVVFDRFLARLLTVEPTGWALKGALALDFRFHPRARTTMDMDLAHRAAEAHVTDILRRAQTVELEDYFTFAVTRTGAQEEGVEASVQYEVRAELAGREFEIVTIHVGVSDRLLWTPIPLRAPPLLGFASIPPVIVPALELEQHVAEKVHAYTRVYGPGRIPSTRPKDLVDIALIREAGDLSARRLRRALEATFAHRATHELPPTLPKPPASWSTSYRRLARDVGLEPGLDHGYASAAAFINPVLDGSARGRWNSQRGAWGVRRR